MQELLHSLGINWGVFIAQIVNFTILLAVLAKFVYRPVMKLLDERREKIAETERQKSEVSEKLVAIEAERQVILEAARAESIRVIESAKHNGEEVKKKLLVSAQEEIARMKSDVEKKIAGDRVKLISDVRRELGTLVVDAIDRSFGDVVDQRTQGKMVEQALAAIRGEVQPKK